MFLLTTTVVAGVGTSSVTEYKNRLTDAERARLEKPTPPTASRDGELVRIYRSWMDALDQQLTEQVAYFTVTLLTLVFGVLTLLAAATLVAVENLSLADNVSKPFLAVLQISVVLSVFAISLLATRLSIKKLEVDV